MLTEYSPRGCTPDCRIFSFLICFIWLFMLFQDQTYMMGVYVPSYGVRLSSPKVANLPRLQVMAPTPSCQVPEQMSLSTTPAVDWVWWAGLVPCSEAAAKQCASWGTVRRLSTKGMTELFHVANVIFHMPVNWVWVHHRLVVWRTEQTAKLWVSLGHPSLPTVQTGWNRRQKKCFDSGCW